MSDEDGDDEHEMAASSCLEALKSVVQSTHGSEENYAKAEAAVMPVIQWIFTVTGDNLEFVEGGFDLLSYMRCAGCGVGVCVCVCVCVCV